MSDHAKNTPSPESTEPWREVFLARFTVPGDVAVLVRVGDLLRTLALECGQGWPGRGESSIRSDLRAAGRDASALACFLDREVAAHRQASALTAEDDALARLAGELASKVCRIAAEIAEQVGPAPE